MNSIKWEGLGGLSQGSILRASGGLINASKPPGTSLPKTPPESLRESTSKILTGEAFFYSPNVSWFLMTVIVWCAFPYNLEGYNKNEESTIDTLLDVMKNRLVINNVLVLAYIGFWHWALYIGDLCNRPFVPNRIYGLSKVLHNMFYTILGIIQWTLVEGAFIHLYKSGKLPYVDATQTPRILFQTLVLSILLPPFRDVHFYFAHRFIHTRPLYKYVHSLHHRNTDTEPFSGLAMHPVEHMYYFTCYAPSLVLPLLLGEAFVLSPFLVFWMGVHLVISPAASHSGYEDHFSADLHHYLHHRYCECNYSAGINFDAIFGTYKASLVEVKPKSGEKNNSENTNGKLSSTQKLPPPPSDPKSSLGFPEHPDYEVGLLGIVLWAIWAYKKGTHPWWVAVAITVGPAVWAVFLALLSAPKSMARKKACLAPFEKDSVASLTLHLGMGFLLGVLPATHLLILFLE